MEFSGPLQKMLSHAADPVVYYLQLGNNLLKMNDLIGKKLHLAPLPKITCNCGLEVSKVFRQNFCYDCFFTKPEAGAAIFNPEKSTAHLGIADRDLAYEMGYQLQPHVVYLANSGGLKVGVTRQEQIPTRWIDQGAAAAIVLAETSNRFEAGIIEVALKAHFADKTQWQQMLVAAELEVDLGAEKLRAKELLPKEYAAFYASGNPTIYHFNYPSIGRVNKVKSLKIASTPEFADTLIGIRGQYLIFESGVVTNIRGQEGQWVTLSF